MIMETIPLQQPLLTVEQVAQRLAVNVDTVRVWLRRGILPGMKISNKEWRVESADLEAFIQRKREARNI